MDYKSFEFLYQDAANALAQRRVIDALDCIQGIASNCNSPEMNAELETVRQDYGMMLDFMARGGNDPQRAIVHRSLACRAFALLDKCARLFRMSHKRDAYTDAANRMHGPQAMPFAQLAATADLLREKRAEARGGQLTEEEDDAYFDAYDKLFEYIWTAPLLTTLDAEELKGFIDRQAANEQALLVAAVMLSEQAYFDPQKFRILLHFCHTDILPVRVRALTASVWTYMQYESRFGDYPELGQGLAMLAQDTRTKDELLALQRQLLLSLETAKVERKIQDEIFPDLLKNRNYQRNKMGLEQMEEDLSKALRGEPNAEWEQARENRALANNMKKIFDMGKEGVDINIGTFSSLKGFPFFRTVAHWFAPFDMRRKEIRGSDTSGALPIATLMEAGNFCDSDKYSLQLLLRQIPSAQREMMAAQIGQQLEGEESSIKQLAQATADSFMAFRVYLQDLYRFYKLYMGRVQFYDPFKLDQLFTRYDILSRMLKSTAYLRDMASFLVRRECYTDAIDYITEVLKEETADAEMLQKVAFCHQQTGQLSQAIYYYQQADLLNPDNEWILTQMYVCYSALGRYEQELGCLKKLEEMNPGNAKLMSETGLCLMQMRRYEEAAQRFYELEYKGERIVASWRAIAWCNFKMKRLEQAEKYYRKILQQEKTTWEDFLNAGHTAWCLGNTAEAIERYRDYMRTYAARKKEAGCPVLQPFDDDRDELLAQGIDPLDICLMRDILLPPPEN